MSQKLKVTELKELLSKAGLVQSGKKDELVKRLLDAGVTGDDASEELVSDAARALLQCTMLMAG